MTRSLRAVGPRALAASLLLSGALVGTALAQTRLSTPLSGPGNGNGGAGLTLDPDAGTVCYDLAYNPGIGGMATAAHMHRGAAGTDGPIVVAFESVYMSGASGCTQGVDAGLIREIIANPAGFYVDVHTDSPNSALRGQLGQQ